jgi:hypothetical protein
MRERDCGQGSTQHNALNKMEAVIQQLSDFDWFCDVTRVEADRVLRQATPAAGRFLVRPCARRKSLAISYVPATRPTELVHTRVLMKGGEWRVENTTKQFPTVASLVQSLKLKPLSR